MAPLSEMSAPAEEVEQQKCTNKSVLCVQGDTDPGLFNPREWTRGQRRGRGAHRGPCCSSGAPPWGAGPGWAGCGEQVLPSLVVLCAGTPLLRPAPQKRQLDRGLSVSRG